MSYTSMAKYQAERVGDKAHSSTKGARRMVDIWKQTAEQSQNEIDIPKGTIFIVIQCRDVMSSNKVSRGSHGKMASDIHLSTLPAISAH